MTDFVILAEKVIREFAVGEREAGELRLVAQAGDEAFKRAEGGDSDRAGEYMARFLVKLTDVLRPVLQDGSQRAAEALAAFGDLADHVAAADEQQLEDFRQSIDQEPPC